MNRPLKLGFFGFGCVGQGLYDILQKIDFQVSIERICVKDPQKPRSLPQKFFTFNYDDILEDPTINVVVEMISDADEAYEIVKKALEQGKDVVTANKKMVAEHLPELLAIQEATGTSLLYEAAVCGSIPIIRTLAEYYDNELLYSVGGIFNGSSNYILTKVLQENLDYADALKQAQDLGFAEADPTLDVGGFDAKYKLCIVAAQAYGLLVRPEAVFNYGIDTLSSYDARFAQEKGFKIKLVAEVIKLDEHQVSLAVLPRFVNADHYLYHVENEYNAVIVAAAFSQKQVLVGKGAGGHPTGSAVLSDISALRYGYKYEYKKSKRNRALQLSQALHKEVYIRYHEEQDLALFDFAEISVRYSEAGFKYVIGVVSLQNLVDVREELLARRIFIADTGREVPQPTAIRQEADALTAA
ncbi:homoserine dehydrogenase [Eisenibacter elegans]|jgi:homoserine dehydrogenase|uniref:homoserine dehydrogenase n=1 Tax=Eisenibacter elegans TaxID=997 RepID=UPI000401FB09|nr:homoserine dehydrogenase [Eisenibacter elegans]